MKNFKFGFTLAEVLITLSIIGIVAAVTLPNLSSNVNNKALGMQAKKMYNTLSNATAMYLADEGANNFSEVNFSATTFVEKYLKPVSKDGDKYTLNDGSTVIVSSHNNGTSTGADGATNDGYFTVVADTNGTKGPDNTNYDQFTFKIFDDGRIDDNAFGTSSEALSAKIGDTSSGLKKDCNKGAGSKCLGYLIRNGFEMDYDD